MSGQTSTFGEVGCSRMHAPGDMRVMGLGRLPQYRIGLAHFSWTYFLPGGCEPVLSHIPSGLGE